MSLKSSSKNGVGLLLIAITCISVYRVFTQPIIQRGVTSKVPKTLSLSKWQLLNSQDEKISETETSYDQLIVERSYSYNRQNQNLTVQLGYFINTDGDVVTLAKQLSYFKPQDGIRWQQSTHPQIGEFFLGKVNEKDRFLLTCVNPSGRNTVSRVEFTQNRMTYDLNLGQVMRWLLGRSQFFDKRCLLGGLVLSEDSTLENASQELQSIWTEIQPQLENIL